MSSSFNAGSRLLRGRGRPRGSRSVRGNGRGHGGRGLQSTNNNVDDTCGLEYDSDSENISPLSPPPAPVPEVPTTPYVRETWSKYVLHFFLNTRRPSQKGCSYQIMGDYKLCKKEDNSKFIVIASTRSPSNFQS